MQFVIICVPKTIILQQNYIFIDIPVKTLKKLVSSIYVALKRLRYGQPHLIHYIGNKYVSTKGTKRFKMKPLVEMLEKYHLRTSSLPLKT